jgi:hypothetical protein
MSRPGNWSTKKVQERSAEQHSFTYVFIGSGVGLEGACVDLHIRTAYRSNCSALLSWMSRPRNWKNNQEISVYHQSSTYPGSGVALEGTGVDLDVCKIRIKCATALKVGCAAPGIGAQRKFRNVLQISTHSLTE